MGFSLIWMARMDGVVVEDGGAEELIVEGGRGVC
jgi:hypothetical protein